MMSCKTTMPLMSDVRCEKTNVTVGVAVLGLCFVSLCTRLRRNRLPPKMMQKAFTLAKIRARMNPIIIMMINVIIHTNLFKKRGGFIMELSMAFDTMWVLFATALVFFMQAGFAMVETGFTRAKNASNIIMKNLMDFSVGSLIYWIIGFSIMFGTDVGGFVGSVSWLSLGSFEHLGLGIPLNAFLIFCF